jgi:Transposase DDE domain group 1
VKLSESARKARVAFDDANLVSHAGLVSVVGLALACGLGEIMASWVRLPSDKGANAGGKVVALVAGMLAGADCIDGMRVLRHGGMAKLFSGLYAPSTLGEFLRAFTHGHVSQLHGGARQFLTRLAQRAPLLPGPAPLVFIDVDSMLRPVFGRTKQGASFGHARVGGRQVLRRGLSPMIATISTPDVAPVVAETMLRSGKASPTRGAAIVKQAIATAWAVLRAQGSTPTGILVRGDAAFFSHKFVRTCLDAGVWFSVTARMDSSLRRAIAAIAEPAWVDITYKQPIWDDQEQRLISHAQIAEITYTAFASRYPVTARLIVRRVPRLRPAAGSGQPELDLGPLWRYHAVFTDSPYVLAQAEAQHRDHAIIEQVNAELIDGALAHLPSASFAANNAWLALAAITHNLARAAGMLAGSGFARARAATIRACLIAVAARIACHARGLLLHLPQDWPWQDGYENLHDAAHAPPRAA